MLVGPLLTLVQRLRRAQVPVAMTEVIEAARALGHLDLADRATVKAALGAVLIKRADDLAVYGALFDATFAAAGAQPSPASTNIEGDLAGPLIAALLEGDDDALAALAALAVDRFAGPQARSARYLLYRVLRALDLSRLAQQAQRAARDQAGDDLGAGRLARHEVATRVEELRRLIAAEAARRASDGDDVTSGIARLAVEDIAFDAASPIERREMRRVLGPLARKLAARVAHRRRLQRRGRLDVRRTVRKSMSTGGVMLDVAWRRPHVTKPELFVLCDVSGSVADSAAFTLAFLSAMSEEFSRVRSFAFVDGVAEVTDLLRPGNYELSPHHLLSRAGVVATHGHSDYGQVLWRFWDTYGAASLSPRSTVIVTGDARNHGRPDGREALDLIASRARRVYWLNPEPRRQWDTGDSIMSTYAPSCDGVFAVANLMQLSECVYAIA